MCTTILIVCSGLALLFALSRGARRFARAGVSAVARAEEQHHVFSAAAALLLALVALATVCGLLLMWALRAYVDFFTFI